jgi:hypothetical protein
MLYPFMTVHDREADGAPMTAEVLTIKDVGVVLKPAETTVYAMANEGELSVFKIWGQERLREIDFDQWMVEQGKAGTPRKVDA